MHPSGAPFVSNGCLKKKEEEEREAVQRIVSRRIGGESLVVLKVLICGLDAGTPCLPWQQLHPGSLPPHRHVFCQSNPQQQHRIAQAPPRGAALARLSRSAVGSPLQPVGLQACVRNKHVLDGKMYHYHRFYTHTHVYNSCFFFLIQIHNKKYNQLDEVYITD